jgi:lysozyme
MIDPRLRADVAKAEGCRLTAYRDSLGYFTIGYGHLLVPIDHDWTGETCTQEQADAWLTDDLGKAAADAQSLPDWAALDTAARENAVIELVFNLGLHKWEQFMKTRDAIQEQDWPTAAAQLLQSRWAAQVGAVRSQRIHDYILTGAYS